MKKIMLLAVALLGFSVQAEKYPMRCTDDPESWSKQEKTITKSDKKEFKNLEKEAQKTWKDLQRVVKKPDFKKYGMGSDSYKKWATAHEKLDKKFESASLYEKFLNTDYNECVMVLKYAIVFQTDYARGVALNNRVEYYKNEVVKHFKLLKK